MVIAVNKVLYNLKCKNILIMHLKNYCNKIKYGFLQFDKDIIYIFKIYNFIFTEVSL